jgi:hypothetical protein
MAGILLSGGLIWENLMARKTSIGFDITTFGLAFGIADI